MFSGPSLRAGMRLLQERCNYIGAAMSQDVLQQRVGAINDDRRPSQKRLGRPSMKQL